MASLKRSFLSHQFGSKRSATKIASLKCLFLSHQFGSERSATQTDNTIVLKTTEIK